MELYKSNYEAYPFLSDDKDLLYTDYELITDKVCSMIGLLRSSIINEDIRVELLEIAELVYHANACLRTKNTIKKEEVEHLHSLLVKYRNDTKDISKFVLPVGCTQASIAHLIRVECKAIVRLLYKNLQINYQIDVVLIDLFNLLSGYFFYLALNLNKNLDVEEISFVSRNYK